MNISPQGNPLIENRREENRKPHTVNMPLELSLCGLERQFFSRKFQENFLEEGGEERV